MIRPGDIVHVISRFVNREFRLNSPVERAEFLRRLAEGIDKTDWRLLSYALMSSHIHTGYVAGRSAFGGLMKCVHSPFAGWLNRREGRLGPVFAGRPKTIIVEPGWTGRLIAYQHNNPPRAGVVRCAADSDWTSHRAFAGLAACPEWLSVELGLSLMGFSPDPEGRQAFDDLVATRAWEPRDSRLTGEPEWENRRLRRELGRAVCLQHPRTGPSGLDYRPIAPARRWSGSLHTIIGIVAMELDVTYLAISSRSRIRELVAARRLVALCAELLGVTNREVGLHLGISDPAVRNLKKTAAQADEIRAAALVGRLTSGMHVG